MYDFLLYLNQTDAELVRQIARASGELATAHEELGSCRVQHETAYVTTMMRTDGSVAEREREARAAAMHLRVAILDVEARVQVLVCELELLRYLRSDPSNAQ